MTETVQQGTDAPGGVSNAPGGAIEQPTPEKSITRGRLVFRRFLRNKLALLGGVVVVLLYVVAFSYPLFSKYDYTELDYTSLLTPPDATHWFGTDKTGTDMFAQTMRGLQKSLTIGLLVGLFSTGFAALVGATAGYFRGWVDRTLLWLVDLLLVLPSFLIIAVLSPAFKGKTWLIFVALLAAFSWMITARIVRGMTLTLKEREFVKAAKYMGQSSFQIIFKHIVPNMASLLIIDATINVGGAILAESGLSYLGFGVQSPDVSLGTLIALGQQSAQTFPWLFLAPASFLVITVLAVNFMGDGLRDALDPTSNSAKRKERKRAAKVTKKEEAVATSDATAGQMAGATNASAGGA